MLTAMLERAAQAELAKYSYGTVQIDIPVESPVGQAVALLQAGIAEEDLMAKGIEPEPHITVRYGLLDEDYSHLVPWILSLEPFTVELGTTTAFPPTPNSDGAAVLIVPVKPGRLEELNRDITAYASFKPSDFNAYQGHITLAYLNPDAAAQYTGADVLEGMAFTVTVLTVSSKDEEAVTVPLKQRGWIGVDLDGTLAQYAGYSAEIGPPTPADPATGLSMVARVKDWLAAGQDVRIFTARITDPTTRAQQLKAIEDWCSAYIGRVLPVTNIKDHYMVELWDDRAVRVGRNTGAPLSPFEKLFKFNPDQPRVPAGQPGGGEFGSGGEGASPAEHSLRTSRVHSSKVLGSRGHVNTVHKVVLEDGRTAIYKPHNGESTDSESGRTNVTPGYQTEREVGAYEVAKLTGMTDLVPAAVDRTVLGGRGALMEFREGRPAAGMPEDGRQFDGTKDLARAAVFDYVIGNEDRHTGNWLVAGPKDGKAADMKLNLIDHGLAFPDKADKPYGSVEANHAIIEEVVNRERFPALKTFAQPYVKNREAILSSLKSVGLPKGAINGVDARIRELAKHNSWMWMVD